MYSNIIEAWNKDPVKEITNKLSKNRKLSPTSSESEDNPNFIGSSDSISLSEIGSLSLMSERKNSSSEHKSILKPVKMSLMTDSDSTICTNSIKHLKSCDHCYYRLKQMIDDKVSKKFDELILDNKLKELQNSGLKANNTYQQPTVPISGLNLDSFLLRNSEPKVSAAEKPGYLKETLIIIIGIIIILLIIFLIIKVIQK